MEEEGEDQEDKWTREKLDQIQPTNPISTASFSIGPELSQPKPEAPTATARAPTPNKNIIKLRAQKYKEKYCSCNSCGALLHCSGESWEEESL